MHDHGGARGCMKVVEVAVKVEVGGELVFVEVEVRFRPRNSVGCEFGSYVSAPRLWVMRFNFSRLRNSPLVHFPCCTSRYNTPLYFTVSY